MAFWVKGAGKATGDLLVEDLHIAVGVAACGALDGRRRQDSAFVLTLAGKDRCLLAKHLIDGHVAFIVVDGVGGQRGVIVRKNTAGDIGRRQRLEHTSGEDGDPGMVEGDHAIRITLARNGITNLDGHCAFYCLVGRISRETDSRRSEGQGAGAGLVGGGHSGLQDGVYDLTVAFVIAKEEGVIFPDGAAKGAAELIANEGGLALRRLGGWSAR